MPIRIVESWAAFLALEPDIGTRIDTQTGIVAAAALWPHQKKGGKSKPRNLMPKWGGRRKQNSGAHLLAWAAAKGAKIPAEIAETLHG